MNEEDLEHWHDSEADQLRRHPERHEDSFNIGWFVAGAVFIAWLVLKFIT